MDQATPSPTGSFDIGDLYYALFRHKWKIILCSVLGIAAALAYYRFRPAPYKSEAKLFIRYVITEATAGGPGRENATFKSPDQRGETIISSEIEILNSLDLAEEVARAIGPERILPRRKTPPQLTDAALFLRKNLTVDVPRNSSVIQIVFEHSDPEIARSVLTQFVDGYLQKHVEIHRATGIVDSYLSQETDQLRARLAQTEEELRKVTNKAGVVSLEEFKKSSSEQVARLKQQIFDLEAELAERSAVFQEMTHRAAEPSAPARADQNVVPPEQWDAYTKTVARLNVLRQREDVVLSQFTRESPRVQEIESQIQEVLEQKKQLEAQYPGLVSMPVSQPAGAAAATGADYNPTLEAAKINALQAKLKILNGQLEQVRTTAANVDQYEMTILDLRRRKELEETNYKYYAATLEQSRINEPLGNGRISNISKIEAPTPAVKDTRETFKMVMGLAVGGVAAGLAWALALEFYFDRTVRRPADIERNLKLPLFLSVPRTAHQIPGKTTAALATSDPTRGTDLALSAYHETLRDRLISYFESINLRHKPKLVAVTGLGSGSGVTTIAAGLARSFSEIGEGNVLLVDMTQGQGSAQHFQKGQQICGLEQLLHTKDPAQVQDNLYVVTEATSSDRLAKGMPQRFSQLVPKLKASDFEYIIFDMPPVNQISITPRLASFMDMVLLVIESEKTDREIVQHATDLLAQSKSNVGAVLNKTRHYVPKQLHQDRGFLLGT